MSLTGTCPGCGQTAPLEHFLLEASHRRALGAALKLAPELAEHLVPYLALHAPRPHRDATGQVSPPRRLATAKLTRLLDELHALISSGQVSRHGDSRAAPLAAWVKGLTEILASRDAGTLDLPLQGHGLLCAIVYRQALGGPAAASDRPLHPSHQPAQPPVAPRRTAGAAALVGDLVAALKPGSRPT